MNGPPGEGWTELYGFAVGRLGESRAREARWMVEEASGLSWSEIVGGRDPVVARARRRLMEMIERRAGGEPLQYVLGRWSFRRLDLMVDRRVLIPRPETEQVVEVALAELDRTSRPGGKVAVDLGTGSGAIALSIAAERRGVAVWATDKSGPALEVARSNLAGLAGFAATRVRMVEGHWWSALPETLKGDIDLVVSNPPYISSMEMSGLKPEVREWEPSSALESGPSGLEAVEEILASAPQWLAAGGVAVLELAPHQASQAAELARRVGFSDVMVHPDLAGRDRALVARL